MSDEGAGVIYRKVRYRRLSTANASKSRLRWMTALRFRNIVVLSALLCTLVIALYVSVPDFPYKEKAWQVNLWSDPSGWWSEITWVIAFGVFISFAVLFRSWFDSLRPSGDLVLKVRIGVILTIVSWETFSIAFLLYFKPVWHDFYSNFMLDRTGTLHGLFYIGTAHLGVLAGIFGLGLVARVVSVTGDNLRSRCNAEEE